MKYSLLLPLAAFVVAVACTDSTAPANSHASLTPRNPTPVVLGDPPPPPVDAAITITVSSHIVLFGAFDGVYFANGSDESLSFLGTAWLRLDNNQPELFGTSASANARFQRTDQKLFGMGTLMIGVHTIRIDRVTSFEANPSCSLPGEPCAVIMFDATVDNMSGHHGTAEAFDREFCHIESEGGIFYSCPPPPPPDDEIG